MSIERALSPDVSLQHFYGEGNDNSSQNEDDILNDSLEFYEQNARVSSDVGQQVQNVIENYISDVGSNIDNKDDSKTRNCSLMAGEEQTGSINDESRFNKKYQPNTQGNNNNNNNNRTNSSNSNENKRVQQPRKNQQNIIERNRRKIRKGHPKESYSKMHQRRLLETQQLMKTRVAKTVQENITVDNLTKSSVADDPSVQSANENIMHYVKPVFQHLDDAPKGNTFLDLDELDTRISIERSQLANSNQNIEFHSLHNPAGFENHFHANGYECLPPIQEVFSSVQSAPGKFSTNYDHQVINRPNSLQCISEIGYGRLHTKQYTYKPYTYFDYKKLKQNVIPSGGLGPNTNNEEYKEKVKRASRQRDYADLLREKHRSENKQWKKKLVSSAEETTPEKHEASSRRKKALEYAKEVPKPIVPKTKSREQNKTKIVNQGNTLLEILRQRHQKEKEAIDAVRKDLQTKLKS